MTALLEAGRELAQQAKHPAAIAGHCSAKISTSTPDAKMHERGAGGSRDAGFEAYLRIGLVFGQ